MYLLPITTPRRVCPYLQTTGVLSPRVDVISGGVAYNYQLSRHRKWLFVPAPPPPVCEMQAVGHSPFFILTSRRGVVARRHPT